MRKSIVSLLVAAGLALGTGAASAEVKNVRMGTEGAYAPYNFIDESGKLTGFDIEIGDALCAAMKVECEWVTSDWDGIIPALLAKKFDTIIASMSITEERMKKIGFSDKYYNTPNRFTALKDSGINVEDKASLKGKVVGVQTSTTQANFLNAEYADVLEIKEYSSQEEANLDFASGRVDMLFTDVVVAGEFLKTKDGATGELTGPGFTNQEFFGEGAGIGVRKEDNELREMLNKAIAQIIADGTYDDISNKYFGMSVYGE